MSSLKIGEYVFFVVLMIFDISSFLSLWQSDSVTDNSTLTITIKMNILYSDILLYNSKHWR